nr:putative ribonuclease H-like domain-containing protein [Tanacetum cinerariifolium]
MQLFKKVSNQKDNTLVTSANTKFTKQPVVENLPKVGKTNALSKPVTSNSVPSPQEPKSVNNDKVIAPGMFRINHSKTSREEKQVPKTVSASARTKPMTVSQPSVITKKDVNSDLNGLSSTGVDNNKTRRPQLRSNTKNDRVPSVSKSSQSQNKEAEVEEQHRNLLLYKNNKHISSACNNIKINSQDVISKVVCAMYLFMVRQFGLFQAYDWKSKASHQFHWKFIGTVRFENDHVDAIMGFGQFCDSDLEVAFRRNACFVRNLEGVDLLKRDRSTNLYTINLQEMAYASPIYLMARASSTKIQNQVLKEYFDTVGISHQMSSIRTPQQNRVVERRNRTLVEAARTMLIFSRAPLFLWAEAIATACFTQNRAIIHHRFNKTPYELINGRKPNISFLHVYVDDIIFGSTHPRYIQLFSDLMKSLFEMSMMGEMTFFLGLQVNQSPCGIFINQSKYMLKILNKYGMASCDPVGTPMEIKDKLDLDQNGTPVDAT